MNFVTIVVLWLYRRLHPKQQAQERHSVLLVTAHPDDEAMFFQPTISELSDDYVLHLLCMSGSEERQEELKDSCRNLGIDHFECVTSDRLVDGLKEKWDEEEIRTRVLEYARGHNIKAVFTFDERGVSSHPNHIAVSKALSTVATRDKTDHSIKFYQLESVNLLRKYSGCLDLMWSMLSNFLFAKFSPLAAYRAMSVHRSQFVWYRRLFVLFSRYSYVNTYAGYRYIDL